MITGYILSLGKNKAIKLYALTIITLHHQLTCFTIIGNFQIGYSLVRTEAWHFVQYLIWQRQFACLASPTLFIKVPLSVIEAWLLSNFDLYAFSRLNATVACGVDDDDLTFAASCTKCFPFANIFIPKHDCKKETEHQAIQTGYQSGLKAI